MNNHKTIYVLIGIPGAGKSYYRETNLNSLKYISCDEIREKHFGQARSFEIRQKVTNIIKENLRALGSENCDFVIDSTYFNKKSEREFLFENFINYNIVAIYLNTSLERAILQNSQRETHRKIAREMIEKFYNEIEPPTQIEPFYEILNIS
jgi:predicted kinase